MSIKNYYNTYKRLSWATSRVGESRNRTVENTIKLLPSLAKTFEENPQAHSNFIAKELNKAIEVISNADLALQQIEIKLPDGMWGRDLGRMRSLVFGITFDEISNATKSLKYALDDFNPTVLARDYTDACEFVMDIRRLSNAVETNRIVIESFDHTDPVWYK